MEIKLEKDTHTYIVDGDIASISVTELLAKHNLAPDYSQVNKSILRAKASRGTQIHEDLENVLNIANYEPTTANGKLFLDYCNKNIECACAEQALAYDYNGMLICGTADIMGFMKDGKVFVADHKTTTSFHRESVSWQVSILDYMARKCSGLTINGKPFNWKGANAFYCFHYKDDNSFEIKELVKIADEEIEELFRCEYNNELYQKQGLIIAEDLQEQLVAVETQLHEMEIAKKMVEEQAKALRQALLNAMEEQNIVSWETPNFIVSYIAGQDRVSVDSAKIKKQYPEIFSECQKLTKVAPSVRIRFRGE